MDNKDVFNGSGRTLSEAVGAFLGGCDDSVVDDAEGCRPLVESSEKGCVDFDVGVQDGGL